MAAGLEGAVVFVPILIIRIQLSNRNAHSSRWEWKYSSRCNFFLQEEEGENEDNTSRKDKQILSKKCASENAEENAGENADGNEE